MAGYSRYKTEMFRKKVETALHGEALFARLEALDRQPAKDQAPELSYILSFADKGCFDTETACNQLRSLWTAYCLHHDLDVDTSGYDHDLMTVWERTAAAEGDTVCWSDYAGFDSFMCAGLV